MPPPDAFADYLRAEFDHVAESLLKNEEDGEKRASFFVTLTSAVGAALAFAVGSPHGLPAAAGHPLVIAMLVVLLAMGYLTFVRIVSRNVASDRYKRRLNRVRRYFLAGADDPRLAFVPFDPYKPESGRSWSWDRVGKGGWLETLVLVNALIFGALATVTTVVLVNALRLGASAAVSTAPEAWGIGILVGIVYVGLGWSWLMAHGTERYRREMWRPEEGLVLERGRLGKANHAEDRRAEHAQRRLARLGCTNVEDESGAQHEPCSRAVDQVLCLVSGTMTVTDVARSETVTVRPGDLLFIPADLGLRVQKGHGTRWVVGLPKHVLSEDPGQLLRQTPQR